MDGAHIVHASCVSFAGRAALILGASGSGKSALALDLMARGADLVADDRTALHRKDDLLIAQAPTTITGMIEARGIGILRGSSVISAPLALAVDLDRKDPDRLPQPGLWRALGVELPCLPNPEGPHLAATILLCLNGKLSFAP